MPQQDPFAQYAVPAKAAPPPPAERTPLTPAEEQRFQAWAKANKISDVDQPGSYYDYRGYWKEHGDAPIKFGVDHFTDTYKQHGHPSFSAESKYSRGLNDGGQWLTEDVQVGPPMASHQQAAPAGEDPFAAFAVQSSPAQKPAQFDTAQPMTGREILDRSKSGGFRNPAADLAAEHPYITGGALALAGGGAGIARSLTAKGMSAVARAWSVAKSGGTALTPVVKYEIAHQTLAATGLPEWITVPAAMAASGLKAKPKAAEPAPAATPEPAPAPAPAPKPAMDVNAMSRDVYRPPTPAPVAQPVTPPPVAAAPAPQPQAAPAPPPVRVPPQPTTPAPGTRGVNVSQERWNKAVDALNARRLQTANAVAPAAQPATAPAPPTPEAAPVVPQSPPTPRAGLSPAQTLNEIAIYAKRAGIQRTPEVEAEALQLVSQGKTPAQAIAELQIRRGTTPPPESAPQATAQADPKIPVGADEVLAYARVRRSGKSHQEGMSALDTHRKLAQTLGTPQPDAVRARVADRNATGRWEGESMPSHQATPVVKPGVNQPSEFLKRDDAKRMLRRMERDLNEFAPQHGRIIRDPNDPNSGIYAVGGGGSPVADDVRVISGQHVSNVKVLKAVRELLAGKKPSNKLHHAAMEAAEAYIEKREGYKGPYMPEMKDEGYEAFSRMVDDFIATGKRGTKRKAR